MLRVTVSLEFGLITRMRERAACMGLSGYAGSDRAIIAMPVCIARCLRQIHPSPASQLDHAYSGRELVA
jgi:hypothetical protein